ncbi:MAG: pilus assembly protein PilY, partial [Proteobacteria bacterium]|nr:pilus assembly protein PilY [Pseudomonadota bacterium]
MNILNLKRILAAAALTLAAQANAEDIDLFLGMPPSIAGAPNVLIILDNTGNWTAPFTEERGALEEVFTGLRGEKINVGLMMFTETGDGDSNVDGGYIRAAIRPMDVDPNAERYAAMIAEFHVRDDKSNSGKAGLAMAEAYHYYKGASTAPLTPPWAGNNKNKTDWGTSFTANDYNGPNASTAVWALADNALDSKSATIYNSPVDPTSCAKNYIIYISNGAVQDSNSDNRQAETLLTLQRGDTAQISISPSGSADVVADEWARFMKQSVLDITTYTIDIDPVTTGQGPGWSALLKSMADESGGSNFVAGSTNLGNIVTEIINEILAVNSVFASVALPAASNAQSTFLNRVYIGQFRPDENVKPRWPGNLKQYKLGLSGTEVKVLDAADT